MHVPYIGALCEETLLLATIKVKVTNVVSMVTISLKDIDTDTITDDRGL